MEIPLETLVLLVVVMIAAAVALLELRFLRGRKQVKVDTALERDDAYNAVTTTRAVAESLRQNGRDTTEADVLIYKAENAYDRREFLNAIELADRARSVLMTCKEKDLTSMPEPPPAMTESQEVPSSQLRKLPPNCLESKFMIGSVRDMIPTACDEVRAEASACLERAQACYDDEDYTGALREAMRAKRLLTPSAPAAGKSASPTVIKLAPPKTSAVEHAPRSCPSCHIEISPDDVFCRKCGERLRD
jgi:hypothetical protein